VVSSTFTANWLPNWQYKLGMRRYGPLTIRSSHDTIRIDTKGDDMVIFDTIKYG